MMNLQQLGKHAGEISALYDEKNQKDGQKKREIEQYMSGMVGDVGDLQKQYSPKTITYYK